MTGGRSWRRTPIKQQKGTPPNKQGGVGWQQQQQRQVSTWETPDKRLVSTWETPDELMKPTTFNNSRYTTNIPTDPCTVTTADIKANMRDIHTTIVSQHLAARDNNKILHTQCHTLTASQQHWRELTPAHAPYPSPTKNTWIPFPLIISTQNRSLNTPITTLPPSSHSRTYYTTSLQLPTDTHHAVSPGFVEGSLRRSSPARWLAGEAGGEPP